MQSCVSFFHESQDFQDKLGGVCLAHVMLYLKYPKTSRTSRGNWDTPLRLVSSSLCIYIMMSRRTRDKVSIARIFPFYFACKPSPLVGQSSTVYNTDKSILAISQSLSLDAFFTVQLLFILKATASAKPRLSQVALVARKTSESIYADSFYLKTLPVLQRDCIQLFEGWYVY